MYLTYFYKEVFVQNVVPYRVVALQYVYLRSEHMNYPILSLFSMLQEIFFADNNTSTLLTCSCHLFKTYAKFIDHSNVAILIYISYEYTSSNRRGVIPPHNATENTHVLINRGYAQAWLCGK